MSENSRALGPMPVWNLGDLYPAPNSQAVQADLKKAADAALAIKQRYQGKLGEAGQRRRPAGRGDRSLREPERHHRPARLLRRPAVRRRHGPIAENAKFYGDIQEKITAITTDLIFFELEFNKIDEALLARALQVPALARYKPWIDDLRKEKPYQLDEQLERLFHEKSITAHAAWSRLFNETMTGLRFEVEGEAEPTRARADAQFPGAPRWPQAPGGGRGPGQGVQGQRAPLHADHQHAGQGQGDLRPLARLQGRGRQPASRQPGRARGGRRAGGGGARVLSAHRAPLLRHEGQVARQGQARLLGPQRAAARQARARGALGRRAGDGAAGLRRLRARTWRPSPSASSTAAGSTRRCARARRPAPSRIRRCRRRTPTS